jgi:hypothetical protein
MQLPLVPTWVPTWLVVVNTLLLEAAIGGAIFWFIVRRAEKKQRARRIFLGGLVAAFALHVVGALDTLLPTYYEARTFTTPLIDTTEEATFLMAWQESAILGRTVARSVYVEMTFPRTRAAYPYGVKPTDGRVEIEIDYAPRNNVRADELLDELWELRTAPQTKATGRALWEMIQKSPRVQTDQALARFVGRYRPY